MLAHASLHRFGCGAVVVALLTLAPTLAEAVVIRGTDGGTNTTAPADDPGWANVGSVGGCTGVYLGNGWVLTAAHVWGSGQSRATFNGTSYAIDATSAQRLHQPLNSSPVDLEMFRLVEMPADLTGLTISTTAPAIGGKVVGIGNGLDRASAETWWDSNWNRESGTEAHRGYLLSNGRTKRWGDNTVAARPLLIDDGYGKTLMMETVFDQNATNAFEMQAATGDSGGAMFYKNGDAWELAGLILAVGIPQTGQPSNTVLYGDVTFAADLSRYRAQIAAITSSGPNQVPEPSSLVLLGSLALLGAGYRVWRRVAK